MANFTTRVQLHDQHLDKYPVLHVVMAQHGHKTTIAGSDGKIYKLPHAEYASEKPNFSALQVCTEVQAIIQQISAAGYVLVTQSSGYAFVLPEMPSAK